MVNEEDKVEKTIKTVKDILKDKRAIASKQEEHLSDIRKMMGKEEKGLRRSDRQGTKSQKEQTKRLEYIIEKQNKTNRGEMWKDAKTFGRIENRLGSMQKLFTREKYIGSRTVNRTPLGVASVQNNMKNMPLYSTMKTFGKNFRGMITGKEPGEPKDAADKTKDAFKGMLKFAVGGSIIGMIGKKLFDSSPLLKAMKSLFDTSIMLIFRPIGDMIGGFLRPILLFFMKNIAVPFYKRFKDMSKFGEAQGKKVLGFLLSPQKTIEASITSTLGHFFPPLTEAGQAKLEAAQRYSGIDDWMLKQMMEQEKTEKGETFKYWALNHRRKHSLYGEEGMEQFGMYSKGTVQDMFGSVTGMGTAHGFSDIKKGWEPQIVDMVKSAETSGGAMTQVASIFELMRMSGDFSQSEIEMFQEAMSKTKISGFNIVASFEHIEKLFGKVSDDLSNRLNSFKASQLRYFSHRSTNVGATDKQLQAVTAAQNVFGTAAYGWGDVTGGGLPQLTAGKNVVQQRNVVNAEIKQRLNPGGGTKSFTDRIYNSDGSLKSDGEIRGIAKAMGVTNEDISRIADPNRFGTESLSILRQSNNAALGVTGTKSGNDKKARAAVEKYNSDLSAWVSGGMVGQAPQMGDLRNLAGGGLITEPVFGIGASGQRYAIAENGAERIMPAGNNSNGGINHILNINIGNVSKEADFDKLKPHIQRWILEANSRRGMI